MTQPSPLRGLRSRTVTLLGLLALAAFGCNRGAPAPAVARPDSAPAAAAAPVARATSPDLSLSVTGLVRQPLNLTVADLRRYESAVARLNEVRRDGSFHGVFYYRGVPLKALLEQAVVSKESAIFNKQTDLAVIVRNRGGEEVVLSWGEIFYRNGGEILIAYEAEPKIPHRACGDCHDEATYKPRQDQLYRQIGFPKLVTGRDFFTDRALEEVVSVEVADLGTGKGFSVTKENKPKKLFSPEVVIDTGKGEPIALKDLSDYPRIEVQAIQTGDGTGFHGLRSYSGASLREVLLKVGVGFDPRGGILMSAPDGYRVLLSNGELMAIPGGKDIVLADRVDGKPFEDGGAFQVVMPGDQGADRWLKSVARIDIVHAGI